MESQAVDEKPLIACRWRPYYPVADLQGKIVEVVQAVHADYFNCLMAMPYSLIKHFDPGQLPPGTTLGLEHPLASNREALPAASLANLYAGAQAAYVMVGDQSNRMVCQEGDEDVRWQLEQVLSCGLNVLLCVQQPTTQLEHYMSDLSSEQIAKMIIVLQGNWPSYYAGDELLPEIHAALDDFRVYQEQIQALAKVPLLLSLPSYIDDAGELVSATLPYCQGYYFTSASTHAAQLLNLLHAVVIQAQTTVATKLLDQPIAPVVESPLSPVEEPSFPVYKDDPSVFDASLKIPSETVVEEFQEQEEQTLNDASIDEAIAEAFEEPPSPPIEENAVEEFQEQKEQTLNDASIDEIIAEAFEEPPSPPIEETAVEEFLEQKEQTLNDASIDEAIAEAFEEPPLPSSEENVEEDPDDRPT